MVFKCPVVKCIANNDCYDRGAVFSLPEKEEQKKQWIKFSNRKDISSIESIFATDTLQTIFRRKVPKEQIFYMNINP